MLGPFPTYSWQEHFSCAAKHHNLGEKMEPCIHLNMHLGDDIQNLGQKESFSLLRGDEFFSCSFFLMLK
ncbi:hypothetical protein OPV22_009610 [Ensete ventricosum]|uniref:Uncharacterized protein n=1 Tax=Ensete ventricosum TaxID=4639 RepID=A0AAV8R5J7_ENSVE|nr:hypothetical protein OPV22_009610 [Ensete ventricosum]